MAPFPKAQISVCERAEAPSETESRLPELLVKI